MDEIKTTRNLKYNFSLVLPDPHLGSGKYPTLENEQKTELIRINYLYVFGLPYPNGSISHFIDQNIVLVKLQNVCPTNALRPRYQEGFMIGKYPFMQTKEAGDNLARRLVAKFLLNNESGNFWDKYFQPLPEEILYPQNDSFGISLKQKMTAWNDNRQKS